MTARSNRAINRSLYRLNNVRWPIDRAVDRLLLLLFLGGRPGSRPLQLLSPNVHACARPIDWAVYRTTVFGHVLIFNQVLGTLLISKLCVIFFNELKNSVNKILHSPHNYLPRWRFLKAESNTTKHNVDSTGLHQCGCLRTTCPKDQVICSSSKRGPLN